jgi:hypothetical protein
MRFQVKIIAAVVVVMGGALLFMLFFKSSDEQAIEELCRKGAEAAQKADADGVIALISTSFKGEEGGYDEICRRIRSRLVRSPGFVEVTSFVAQVDGENATATVGVRGYAGRNELWKTAFSLRLRKEAGQWKVTGAEEVGR